MSEIDHLPIYRTAKGLHEALHGFKRAVREAEDAGVALEINGDSVTAKQVENWRPRFLCDLCKVISVSS